MNWAMLWAFGEVRNPAQVSARDINTLKRIYEQPTRLGWPMANRNATKPDDRSQ